MSQLTIYKASAGSGKTFRLVIEYLKLLMVSPYNYRHILAVTFTNKATSEMKDRILRDLNKVAIQSDAKLIQLLNQETGIHELKLVENAKLALSFILHDYDRFAVSTIDSFFQRVLRSFARETGLHGTYEIELDQEAVLAEACDRLLLGVEHDAILRNWLLTMSEDLLSDGKSWKINDKILELGKELQKESFQQYLVHQESLEVEREKITQLKSELLKTKKMFVNECNLLGKKGLDLIAAYNLTVLDFKYKSASFANAFNKLANFKNGTIELGKRFEAAIDNLDSWSSVKEKNAEFSTLYSGGLNDLMHEISVFIDSKYTEYNTAAELYKFIYALGVLTIMNSKVREIGLENNSLLLSEGNMLLRGLIGNNDAPFVYEKIGTYYRYFMIDEFQDTSVTQWENFKPLVNNSLAENNPNLIVGDVKQSIYRWRNSDWQLLNKHIKKELERYKVDEVNLESNWRSSDNIVEFNNRFFELSKDILQQNYNLELDGSIHFEEYKTTIQNAYADIVQKPASGEEGGYVQCAFIDKENYEEQTLKSIVKAVMTVQDKGFLASDIAILVKKNKQGKKIAEALLQQKKLNANYNFEVISDDTLFIDSSATVRFLVGLMKYILTPFDQVNRATVVYDYSTHLLPALEKEKKIPPRIIPGGQQTISFNESDSKSYRFISDEVINEYFPFFKADDDKTVRNKWSTLSLIDLTETFIHRFQLNLISGEQATIQAFKDVVNDFSKRESSNLHKFMDWWMQFGEKVKLQSAGQRDAIRIMTIHKSKGLEFPVVLLPFCDWGFAPDAKKTNIIWCDTSQTPFQQFPILPVKFTSSIRNTLFSKEYFTETLLSYIDNLNVLYVAQTRAIRGLYLFTEANEKPNLAKVSGLLSKVIQQENPENLFSNADSNLVYSFGELNEKGTTEEKRKNEVNLSGSINSNKKVGEALRLRKNFVDFLDESKNSKTAKINDGKLFHELLSRIEHQNDIPNAIQRMKLTGQIEEEQTPFYYDSIQELMKHPQTLNWFNGTFQIMNETTILSPGFGLHRPDRIMIRDNEVIVVDFKATDKISTSHQLQVQSYVDKVMEIGYSNVKGYVWYLKSNQILSIKDEF